jgi:DNA-binding transcriptional ArsR family regulator
MVVQDEQLDLLFRALADATRRDILRRTLVEEVSVSGLSSAYAMSFAAVQKHVSVLEAAGLVHKTPQGRERLVRADPDQLARARALLAELETLWTHRLNRLDDLFKE